MKKRWIVILVVLFFLPELARAQEALIAPPERLSLDNVPKIPAALADTAGRYASFRSASLSDWHPTKHEMLIATRFAETAQLHIVAMPGGARQQLTFYSDAVTNGINSTATT